jgi:mono/diheme cytochrome c family protein
MKWINPAHAAGCLALMISPLVWANGSGTDPGRIEYEASCARCHGAAGRGDGPMAPWLIQKPSDLTGLSRRNGGALPVQLVWELIDGRAQPPEGRFTHGPREMPVWGDRYRAQARTSADPYTASHPEWFVRGRIVALIDYLQRIQSD